MHPRVLQTQGEEPKEFLQLFPKYQVVDPTEALESGLNRVEFIDHATRLFVLVFDGVRAKLGANPYGPCVASPVR